MAINGISFAGNQNYDYQAPATKEAVAEAPIFNQDATDTIEINSDKKGVNKGLIAGIGLGIAALATTAYAYKTGKANSKDGAKLGEILSKGFRGIGEKISGLFKKQSPEVKSAIKNLKQAEQAANNFHVPQDSNKLAQDVQNARKTLNNILIQPGESTLDATLHSGVNSAIRGGSTINLPKMDTSKLNLPHIPTT